MRELESTRSLTVIGFARRAVVGDVSNRVGSRVTVAVGVRRAADADGIEDEDEGTHRGQTGVASALAD
jgi:hypothetical protein